MPTFESRRKPWWTKVALMTAAVESWAGVGGWSTTAPSERMKGAKSTVGMFAIVGGGKETRAHFTFALRRDAHAANINFVSAPSLLRGPKFDFAKIVIRRYWTWLQKIAWRLSIRYLRTITVELKNRTCIVAAERIPSVWLHWQTRFAFSMTGTITA